MIQYKQKEITSLNYEVLEKIPFYNKEIKYILKHAKSNFIYVCPRVLQNYMMPIILNCLEFEKDNIPPEEWISKLGL